MPFDRYVIEASAPATSLTRFTYPDDEQDVRVAPGQRVSFGNITGASVNARSISTTREKNDDGNYTGEVEVSWRFDADVDDFSSINHQIEVCVTEACADADWAEAGFDPETGTDSKDDAAEGIRVGMFTAPDDSDGGFRVRVSVEANEDVDDTDTARTGVSAETSVGEVDSAPSGITAVRDTDEDATTDSLTVNWKASTNTRTATRVVITVEIDGLGKQSLIAEGGQTLTVDGDTDATSAWYNVGTFSATPWTVVGTEVEVSVTEDILRKALEVRVETRQDMAEDDEGEPVWNATDTVEVDADPEEDSS